jgi:beta-mannanase
VNCDKSDPWGGAYKGNTVASTIAAFQHEAALVKGIAPNVKIAYSANNDSCYNLASLTAYYPGDNFVDIIGIDGFDFGGQSWDQIFDHAILPLQVLGKPIWILSEGIVPMDNQSQFITDTL